MTPPPNRTSTTICDPSGAGKLRLANALVEHRGPAYSVRIPTDYYLALATPLTKSICNNRYVTIGPSSPKWWPCPKAPPPPP